MAKHIDFMGGTMRLSLFAAVSVAAMAAFLPGSALAANECGDPGANGATADVFACTGTIPSISYSTNGNLTLTLTSGPTVTTGGISVTGNGANTVTINRNDTTAGAGDPSITNTAGAGISATTGTAALSLALTDNDTGDTPIAITGTTRGVQLQSGATTGTALNLTFTNGSIAATGAGGIGVEATTTSVAAGNLNLNLGGAVSGAVGVQATSSGTGTLNVNVTAVSSSVLGGDIVGVNGPAVRVTPGANGTVAVGSGRTVRGPNTSAVIEFTNVNATRTVTVRNEVGGTIRSNDTTASGYDDVIVSVLGGAGNSNITNAPGNAGLTDGFSDNGVMFGRVSLLNTGNASVSNSGVWYTTGANIIGAGSSNGSLSISGGTSPRSFNTIGTNANGAATSFVFGDGTDTFTNGGTLAVGMGTEAAATLLFSGLDTWTNSGFVLFGSDDAYFGSNGEPVASDRAANDRIAAQGAAFTGAPANNNSGMSSVFFLDVDFSADQADCAAAVTADCLDLRGGGAAGSTVVNITTVGRGLAERIVLVDASGAGTSTAGAFSIGTESTDYRLVGATPTLETGMFLYTLEFDATAKQYALTAGDFSGKALEVARFGRAASEPWRAATGLWHERQADLRRSIAGGDEGMAPAAWLKLGGNFINETRFELSPAGAEYETSASQDTTALVGGVDLVRISGDDSALVFGLTAGKLTSTLDYTAQTSRLDMDGHSFGAYATVVAGRLFVDAIVNAAELDLSHQDFGQTYDISASALGYQVEAGYQVFQFDDGGAYIEPVAALSYVKADVDDLAIGPVAARFDEAASLRAALGVRVAGNVETDALTAQFSFTGRVWQEMEDDASTALDATFASSVVTDAIPETLADLGVAVGLFALDGRLSANIGYGVKFTDDYQSTDASVSFRYSW